MPVADFPGRWNWGYDGVLPFSPDTAYGTPEALRALVDAAHDAGLAVLLDVVYNHFGPAGNFLPRYAPAFFTEAEQTPWGPAIDLTDPSVRAFFVENAVMWLREYDFDGLRLDAVHASIPAGGDALLAEIAAACATPSAPRRRSMWKRSSAMARRCQTGRWTAPPATSASTRSTGCSWTRTGMPASTTD